MIIVMFAIMIGVGHAIDVYTPDSNVLTSYCVINGAKCIDPNCTITITNSTGSVVNGGDMGYLMGILDFTLTLPVYGNYKALIACTENGESGSTIYEFSYNERLDQISLYAGSDDYMLIWLLVVLFVIMMALTFLFKLQLLGILAAIEIILLGFTFVGISSMYGWIIAGSGALLVAYFALVYKN